MLSQHISFIIERISDILQLEKDNKLGISNNVKNGVQELQNELGRNQEYLKELEAKYENKTVLFEHERQHYRNLGNIAVSSDKILNGITGTDDSSRETLDVERDISNLVKSIQNSYNSFPSQPTYIVNTGGNTNLQGGTQIVNSTFSFNQIQPSQMKQDPRPESFGHYPNPVIVGFNHEIESLRNHLLQTYDETRFVGIVGMGGSGKTTLAKYIYHHPPIQTHFTVKVWVCISQSWDKTRVLNSILRQATPDSTTEIDDNQIVPKLYHFLSSKSYLIILDDIWSIKAWAHICQAFPREGRSAVVVTSRNKEVPKTIDPNIFIVDIKQLNDEESYELFQQKTTHLLDWYTSLRSLGVEMINKCNGLPLAIIALAGVLQKNKSQNNWEKISNKLTDHILNKEATTEGVVKEVLALSYDQLPHPLKPCALYLHIFPEDYEIQAQKVIQMWTAERFMDEEYVAEEYLNELAQRCIVEVEKTSYNGQVLEFRIHDLIRQMLVDIDKERGIIRNPVPRLAPWTTLYGHGKKEFDSHMEFLDGYLYENPQARSLIFFNFRDHRYIKLQPMFIKLNLLRVLILDYVPWRGFPNEIGNLIHLRYLELSGRTKRLPGSIGNLENLLTLHLGNLETSIDETINLEKLKELRHLYMPRTRHLLKESALMGLEKLKKLKTLWGAGGEWMLSVMSNLNVPLEELRIWGIEKREELEVVFRIPSITSNNLGTLVLQWNWYPICERSNMRTEAGTSLEYPPKLSTLKLDGKIDVGRPFAYIFPRYLIHLEMIHTYVEEKQVLNIISDSCPLLKFLLFGSCAYMGTDLVCNKNSFPELLKLVFIQLYSVERWIIEKGAMPRLANLMIGDFQLLELNDEGWEHISKIPKLTLLTSSTHSTTFEGKLRQMRKDQIHFIKKPQDLPATELHF